MLELKVCSVSYIVIFKSPLIGCLALVTLSPHQAPGNLQVENQVKYSD